MRRLADATVAVVGLGLMGGSLALALAEARACRRLVGVDSDEATCRAALAQGCVQAADTQLELLAEADAVVLATPARAILALLPRLAGHLRPGTIVADLGSTKREITLAMAELPAWLEPIGGHPMCGRETAGFGAADATLLRGAFFALTPLARTAPATLDFARALVQAVGARPLVLDAAEHDAMVALTSHLPFLAATALVATVEESAPEHELLYRLAATGYADTTRVAAKSTPVMLDILLTNRAEVGRAARACARQLLALADLIDAGRETELRQALAAAADTRRALAARREGAAR
ncbi:MAG: prephenate dehydrogenase [Chloroflexota bacterium]